MRLRIGDLVTIKEERKRTGFVTRITAGFLTGSDFEMTFKKDDLRNIVDRKSIVGVVPRERVKEYWKYLQSLRQRYDKET